MVWALLAIAFFVLVGWIVLKLMTEVDACESGCGLMFLLFILLFIGVLAVGFAVFGFGCAAALFGAR